VDAAKVELAGAPQYANLDLPWSISTAAVLNSVLMGGVEVFRNSELDPEKRLYPGGFFDPLNFADPANPERAFQLKTAEIKHGRLAMVAALGERPREWGAAAGGAAGYVAGLRRPPLRRPRACRVERGALAPHNSDDAEHTSPPPSPPSTPRLRGAGRLPGRGCSGLARQVRQQLLSGRRPTAAAAAAEVEGRSPVRPAGRRAAQRARAARLSA
jgi:hypothetical protein